MKRRLLFVLLTILFVACFVWRVTWFPYRIDRLQAAVPRNAVFASEHLELAARWPEWGSHPLVRAIAVGLGVPQAEWDRVVADPGTGVVLDRMARRHTLTAYAPMLGRYGEPAWIVASWVGLQGQYLRWGIYNSLLKDFEKRTFRDGRRGWVYRDAEGALGDQTLQFAVTEGLLLGCLSRDADAVCALVERVERGELGPDVLRRQPFPAEEPGAALDRVVYGEMEDGLGGDQAGAWVGEFTLVAGGGASGVLHGPAPGLPGLAGEAGGAAVSSLAQVLRATPGMLAIGPVELLAAADALPGIGGAVRLFWDELQDVTPPQGRMFLSLARPAYSGRIMGFKVATLMIGLQLTDAAAAELAIGGALDTFNAQFNTSLIRRALSSEAPVVTTVESVRRGPLSSLGAGEQLSYALVDGWLILSSNNDALSRMLAEREAGGGATPVWARELAGNRGGTMVWMDLADVSDALTKIAAMQDLLAIARGQSREPSVTRRRLALAQAWMGELRELERLRLWAETRHGDYWVKFQLGPSVAP